MNKKLSKSFWIASILTFGLSAEINAEVRYLPNALGVKEGVGHQLYNGSYPFLGTMHTMMYWGNVSNGKLTPPDTAKFMGNDQEGWLYKYGVLSFPMGVTNEVLTAINGMNNAYTNPFKQEEARQQWYQFLDADIKRMSEATGYFFKLNADLKDYNINKGSFPLVIKGGTSHCTPMTEKLDFKEEPTNVRSKVQRRLGFGKTGSGLCVDLPNYTINRFEFRELPTPKDVAKEFYNKGYAEKEVFGECEFKNFKYNSPVQYKDDFVAMIPVNAAHFGSCPVSRVHIMIKDFNRGTYTVLASYEADILDKAKPVQSQPIAQPSKVSGFKDNSANKPDVTLEKQVIDITK